MWWSKCIICKSRKGDIIKHATFDGITGCDSIVNIYYHKDCLKSVIENPENYDDWIIFNLNSVVSDLKAQQYFTTTPEEDRLKYFKEMSKELKI